MPNRTVIVLALLMVAAVAGGLLLLRWEVATDHAFVLRDAATGKTVSGVPLTVVIEARRPPESPVPKYARLIESDIYGRFDPGPPGAREISEIHVWHVAYRPVAAAAPLDGAILLEKHAGDPSPLAEAELRALGDLDPEVRAALKAGFLRPGPAAFQPREVGGAALAARAPPAPAAPERTGPDADATARAIEEWLGAGRDAVVRARSMRAVDAYLATMPPDAREAGSPALEASVRKVLAAAIDPDLTPRMIALAGALWHGTGSLPAPLVGSSEAVARRLEATQDDLARACARIGGAAAGREIAGLLRHGDLAPTGEWVRVAAATGVAGSLVEGLEAAAGGDPRVRTAAAALKAAGAMATRGGRQAGQGEDRGP